MATSAVLRDRLAATEEATAAAKKEGLASERRLREVGQYMEEVEQ